jgi:hypothetical protein
MIMARGSIRRRLNDEMLTWFMVVADVYDVVVMTPGCWCCDTMMMMMMMMLV